jgi:hypothetical protein
MGCRGGFADASFTLGILTAIHVELCTRTDGSGKTGHLPQTCHPVASVSPLPLQICLKNNATMIPGYAKVITRFCDGFQGQHQNKNDPWITSFTVSSLQTLLQVKLFSCSWAHRMPDMPVKTF